MEHRPINNDLDIESMRQLIASLKNKLSIVDFEEFIQLKSVRQNTRLWFEGPLLIAFAYVDDFNNLCFEVIPDKSNRKVEDEIIGWGLECMRNKNMQSGVNDSLDSSCSAQNLARIELLERMGFIQQEIRSLKFARPLNEPIQELPLPSGYSIRCVNGESEVAHLVSLHRAAFGTNHMTEEYRLAMMHAPDYDKCLDWVAVAPEGTLAGFCIGSIDEDDSTLGYLDPIGVHPDHRRIGLSAAMIAYGLSYFRSRGIKTIQLGTSSENLPMIALAIRSGFTLQSESIWFSMDVA